VAKKKKVFVCDNCGNESAKWAGKCSACNQWNTYKEITVTKSVGASLQERSKSQPVKFNEISADTDRRILTSSGEFNKLLGGGLVEGSVVLVGGEPGVGKSTLMLQLALNYNEGKILYVSGEESLNQIRLRGERIGNISEECYLLSDVSLENIINQIKEINPVFVVIDSVQTLVSERSESLPGSVSQIRECAAELQIMAKENNIPVFLIGHITKDGYLAGPKLLEHIVDVVLLFEGDNQTNFRVLRSSKNRFGSTAELAVFDMKQNGLIEVINPSESLLSEYREKLIGTAVTVSLNGSRAILLETQALVSHAVYGTPQRTCTGFDIRRLNMLLAVIEKRGGYRLISKDVFLNVVGGIKLDEPGNDLAIVAAILSSDMNIALGRSICFAGEVGLSGEIRPVTKLELRIKEAARLGFEKMVISSHSGTIPKEIVGNIDLIRVNDIGEFYRGVLKQ
jgi:DNA repair protein RadA/Sms